MNRTGFIRQTMKSIQLLPAASPTCAVPGSKVAYDLPQGLSSLYRKITKMGVDELFVECVSVPYFILSR